MVLTGATASLTLLAIILNIGMLYLIFLGLVCASYPCNITKSNAVTKWATLKRKRHKTFQSVVLRHVGMIP